MLERVAIALLLIPVAIALPFIVVMVVIFGNVGIEGEENDELRL